MEDPITDYREKSWWLETLPEDIVPNPSPGRQESVPVAAGFDLRFFSLSFSAPSVIII